MAGYSLYPIKNQLFPFSYLMMSHIRLQCPAGTHSKLMETCKFFFTKNPVIVVKEVNFYEDTKKYEDK